MLTRLTKTLLRTTDNYINALEKWGILTVQDLLTYYPRDYEDRTNVLDSFSLLNIKEKNTILVKLLTLNTIKTWGWKLLSKAVIEDKNWFLSEAVWFNRKYLATTLKPYEWKKVLISWKVKYAFWKITFQSPEVETDLSKVAWEIVPVYSDINYIPTKWIAPKIEMLKWYISEISEDLPESIIKKYNFIPKAEAVYKIHFPRNKNDIEQAKYRLAYWELFDINYKSISSKYETFKNTEGKAKAIKMNVEQVKEILSNLPFELTDHQKIVLFQILKDMEKPHSMQRLLEWDVWTWKTAVALVAAIHAILESGKQPAMLSLDTNIPPIPSPFPPGEKGNLEISSFIEPNIDYIIGLARELRKKWTKEELIMWELLRRKQIAWLKFRRQHPFWRYIADFYCDELKLVIELDWKIHDTQKEYDEIRDELISQYWVVILRITNEEINNDIKWVFEKILSPLGGKYPKGDRGLSIQVAIMAPTEILARQHFESMQDLLMKYKISSHLLVWSLTKKQKDAVKADLKTWNIDLVIWTHALVQEDVNFYNLGFIVIDEQHRFWVKQREVLEKWFGNKTGNIPHCLNMTATPIPRTLALTLYWDQDLSIISQYPKWRKDIYTKVAKTENQRQEIERFVRAEVEKWRQAFWISPLVEESEKIDLANAISTYESLIDIFYPFKVWLLHWKMKPKEKDAVMKEFSENKIQILSSTSVVEVWVDIPNATVMCIEWAERFWLSQLHQFRWRVGRWQYQSYCYLFPTTGNYTDRLKAMESTNNGFELAEIDLELRWPWEVYWLRQSWVPDLKVADLKDLALISQIREDIEELFEKKEK
jgi:RecG-like helicase/very-short-patch-repair endonuclease